MGSCELLLCTRKKSCLHSLEHKHKTKIARRYPWASGLTARAPKESPCTFAFPAALIKAAAMGSRLTSGRVRAVHGYARYIMRGAAEEGKSRDKRTHFTSARGFSAARRETYIRTLGTLRGCQVRPLVRYFIHTRRKRTHMPFWK